MPPALDVGVEDIDASAEALLPVPPHPASKALSMTMPAGILMNMFMMSPGAFVEVSAA
jgi:hypothetical protein